MCVSQRFRTVTEMVLATPKEWSEIPGIGKTLANRIATPNPRYIRCGVCGAWMTRNAVGVYRHRRGDGARCNQLLADKARTIAEQGRVPALPLPARLYRECLFCGLEVETDPGGLCPACLGKREAAES